MSIHEPAPPVVLVMDVGGSHVTAAEVRVRDGDVELGRVREAALDSSGDRDHVLGTLAEVATPLARPGAGWAVAMPGPFDYGQGRGSFAGIGKFAAIADLDLRGALAERLRTAPARVRFLNDAAAYGIGEWAHDVERPARMVCITLGTGVGSVFLRDGVAVTAGPDVPADGHAHTITIDGAPLEASVSTAAIRRDHRAASGRNLSVEAICAAARAGDPVATAAVAGAMRTLGRALGPWIERFGATSLVVGGAMARSWDVLEQPLRGGLGMATPTCVRRSRLQDRAPLLGAAVWSVGRPVV